jgi:hypothetical protein
MVDGGTFASIQKSLKSGRLWPLLDRIAVPFAATKIQKDSQDFFLIRTKST